MFLSKNVTITRQMYKNSRIIIHICRIFGYFPVRAKFVGPNVSFAWSPYYALYSFILGTGLAATTSWELYYTYLFSAQNKYSPTAKIASFFAHGGWILTYFIGIFVTANKFITFFAYIEKINQIDQLIKTPQKRSPKHAVVLLFIAPIFSILYGVDAGIMYALRGWTAKDYVINDLFYYILIMFATVTFFNVGYLIHHLEKRLVRLNEFVELRNQNFKKVKQWICTGVVKSQDGKAIKNRIIKVFLAKRIMKQFKSDAYNILELSKIYLKLCDASELLNNLFGVSMMVGIVVAFMQIVQPIYFLVNDMSLYMFTDHIAALIIIIITLIRNLTCVSLIIESAYRCSMQVKSMENYVCQLFYWNTNSVYQSQVKIFAYCLGLRKLEFTACGLFTIDRFLFSNMFGNIVTFLFLLLQMKKREEN